MTNDIESLAMWLAFIGLAALLCLSGDYIRRKTGGRIRHAEIHLLAWLPALALEAALLFAPGVRASAFLLPLIFPALVYGYFFVERIAYPRTWRNSEERLDEGDSRKLLEQQHRERIEAYKHGARPSVDMRSGLTRETNTPEGSLLMSLPSRVSTPDGRAPTWRGKHEQEERSVFLGLKGWRSGIAVCLLLTMVFSMAFSMVFGLENYLGTSVPIEPALLWYACAIAVVSAVAMTAMTRRLSFVLPTLAMAVSIAGLFEGIHIGVRTSHAPFLMDMIAGFGQFFVSVLSMMLCVWSIRALFFRKKPS